MEGKVPAGSRADRPVQADHEMGRQISHAEGSHQRRHPHDAKSPANFGAEGIGLCRTEHMFFDPQRIHHMREMILASDIEARKAALAKLLPYQRKISSASSRR
jgi:phosphoenolpyruvate-protein kinase (PTS system EI component)